MKLTNILPVLVALFLLNCSDNKITNLADYDAYLTTTISTSYSDEIQFWSTKLEKTPNQFPYMAKRASAYNAAFKASGKIEYLIKAEEDLIAVNEMTSYNNASSLRALASNYISQHRFKDALQLLEVAKVIGEQLEATKKMLFDVHLELGNFIYAKNYLDEFKNASDFDYLIRLAKWEDHQGNLEMAIAHLEKAKSIAESSNIKEIKQWAFTNLADFYGHAGRLEDSYQYYLKALELDPNDAYSKKGIAWIVYSHEKNNSEALRILDHINSYYVSPDYDLLKAEIAEHSNNTDLKNKALENYQFSLENNHYGEMYNKYNVMLYTSDVFQPKTALTIAMKEVENRPTPGSYDLLAWSHFKDGNVNKALEIVEEYVDGYTYEPEVLYHIAEIYKAAGFVEKVMPLKKELLASTYELGPLMAQRIEQL